MGERYACNVDGGRSVVKGDAVALVGAVVAVSVSISIAPLRLRLFRLTARRRSNLKDS